MSHSPEAAYGAAYAALVEVLTKAGAEHPHDDARDYLAQLQRDGWQWRARVVPAQRGHRAPPSQAYVDAKERLLEALHTEAMAEPDQTEADACSPT